MRTAMDALIAIHGLSGRAAADVEARFEHDLAREGPLDEGKAAAMGGVLSGAVTGLAADLAAGGLTLGRGHADRRRAGRAGRRGRRARASTWRADRPTKPFAGTTRSSSASWCNRSLRYLAIAHYGRGRGDYVDRDIPAFWRTAGRGRRRRRGESDSRRCSRVAARTATPRRSRQRCRRSCARRCGGAANALSRLHHRREAMTKRKSPRRPTSAFACASRAAPTSRSAPGRSTCWKRSRATGSITAAAKALGMSYRRAWLLVDTMNRNLEAPVVAAEAGGIARRRCRDHGGRRGSDKALPAHRGDRVEGGGRGHRRAARAAPALAACCTISL